MWAIESTLDRAIRLLADQDDFERRARFEYSWRLWPQLCYRSQRRQRWLHRDEGCLLMLRRGI